MGIKLVEVRGFAGELLVGEAFGRFPDGFFFVKNGAGALLKVPELAGFRCPIKGNQRAAAEED